MKDIKNNTVWLLLLSLIGLTGVLPVSTRAADPVLTTVAEVRALTAAEAGKHYPVKLKGVVTFYDDGLFLRFIQDDTAGIYLNVTNALALKPGQVVEVEGVTDPGEFAPVVKPTAVKVVGTGNLPVAKPVTLQELLSGAEDSQMVQISGEVRAVRYDNSMGNYFLEVVMGGERFTVVARQIPVPNPQDLLAATVRVRGVCGTLFNRQRQLFGFRLLVPDGGGLTVENPAPADPFNLPAQEIDSLLQFTPEGTLGHRVKVTGTVVYFEAGTGVFIQNGDEGLFCQSLQRDSIQPGDRVEVVGFPAKGDYTPILGDAIYRKVGTGTESKAETVDVFGALTGVHDCRLVQIQAKVIGRVDRGPNQFLLLKADNFIFQAYFPRNVTGDQLAGIINDSEVMVKGICLIERGNNWQAGKDWRAESFRLLLRSPEDVQVLQAASEGLSTSWIYVVGAVELVVLLVILRLAIFVGNRRKLKA